MGRDVDKHLVKYLNEAHAMELQSMEMLTKAIEISGDLQLGQLYRGHLNETRDHERYEKFEIASYRMLRKVAESAEDEETPSMCDRLTPVEQQAAELIVNNLDLAVQRSLESTVKVAGPAAGRDPGPHA